MDERTKEIRAIALNAALNFSSGKNFQSRHLDAYLELRTQKLANGRIDSSGTSQDDQPSRLRNAEIYDLPRRRISGVWGFPVSFYLKKGNRNETNVRTND